MRIKASNLIKGYRDTEVLNGISLEINQGEQVAVMGPSGVGKSTLLHCLSGLLAPDAGEVTIEGTSYQSLKRSDLIELRQNGFGFIFQSAQLIPELTVIENVMMPLFLDGFSRRRARPLAQTWLNNLQISELGQRPTHTISGGQAQKVAVARALIHSPQVIFADEPTAALDQVSAQEVMQVLTFTATRLRATLILVTHDPKIAQWCQRQVEVRDGLIVSDSAFVAPRPQ